MFAQSIAFLKRKNPWTGRGITVRIAVALLVIAGAVATNRSFLGWGVFASFAVLMVPIGRIRSFLFSFGPYALIWFLFTAARSASDETPLAKWMNLYAPEFERMLFRGQLPTITLQDRFYDQNHLRWYDFLYTFIHWSYFIVPHAMVIYLWYRHPDLFRRLLGAMALLLGMGLAIYFLIPSNPPWMAPEPCNSPACPTPFRVMETVSNQLGGGLYKAGYKVIGESNPRAAMPSIHMAITFLLVFPAFALGRRFGMFLLIYAGLMGYSLIYLGEHYLIDVLAGCGVAAYGWYGFPRVLRLVQRARESGQRTEPNLSRDIAEVTVAQSASM